MQCLEEGTQKLEEGDVQGAKELYKRSVEIKRNASSLFNLGVTHYHLKEFDDAISAWNESIALQPTSADAHTNLASAYIISPVSRPDLALHHLHIAASLSPEDPEIAFNLAAVLEAAGQLEEALEYYKRSKEHGVDRAAMHIRNVSAKILGKQILAVEGEDKPKKTRLVTPHAGFGTSRTSPALLQGLSYRYLCTRMYHTIINKIDLLSK